MKRRSFLKSIVGFLALPYLPQDLSQVKDKPKVTKRIKCRRWAKLEAPTMPLTEGIEPAKFGWKMIYTSRILNDNYVYGLIVKST